MNDKSIVQAVLSDYADKYGTKALKDLLLTRKELYEDNIGSSLIDGLSRRIPNQKAH